MPTEAATAKVLAEAAKRRRPTGEDAPSTAELLSYIDGEGAYAGR